MKISKYIQSISILSLIFLAGCEKMKEVQNFITPTALPTVTAQKLDFQTTENTGKFVINPQFDEAFFTFSEGFAAVRIGNTESGKWGFIDKQGKMVINPQFDSVFFRFSEGLAAVRIGDEESGKWGFIDKQGKIVINPQFNEAYIFSEGLAAVRIGDKKSGRWGYIGR